MAGSRELERLVDEYYAASGSDPRRAGSCCATRSSISCARDRARPRLRHRRRRGRGGALGKLDAYLCELKEMQIRDGLHIFGRAPEGAQLADLLVALARLPRGTAPAASLADPRLGGRSGARLRSARRGARATPGRGPRPEAACWRATPGAASAIRSSGSSIWRSASLPASARRMRRGRARARCSTGSTRTLRPAVAACGAGGDRRVSSRARRALRARRVPSGAPTRGRPEVLPTGRNFYSLDSARRADAKRPGSSAGNRRSSWSSATRRSRAPIRARSRSRPGARPTCAPAATTWRRRWR